MSLFAITAILTAACLGTGAFDDRSLTVSAGGFRLSCRVEGSGPPILFVGSSVYYPRTLSPSLRSRFTIYYLDMPWFVPVSSDVTTKELSRSGIARMIADAHRELKLGKCIVLGHSIHGAVALDYARAYPRNVSKLVLIGAPAIAGSLEANQIIEQAWSNASPERHRIVEANWKKVDLQRIPPERQPIEAYLAITPQAYFDPNYDARWLWEGVHINRALFDMVFDKMFAEYVMFPEGSGVPVPTFSAVGQYDYIYPATMWTRLKPIENLKIKVFERSGHSPMLEEPEAFEKAVTQWLAQ